MCGYECADVNTYHMRRYECADATTYYMCCAAQVREAQQAATHIHRYTYHIHTYRRCAWPSRSRRSATSRRGGARRRPQPRGRPATPLTTQRSPSSTPTHRFAPCVRTCGSVQAEPHAHSGNTPPNHPLKPNTERECEVHACIHSQCMHIVGDARGALHHHPAAAGQGAGQGRGLSGVQGQGGAARSADSLVRCRQLPLTPAQPARQARRRARRCASSGGEGGAEHGGGGAGGGGGGRLHWQAWAGA